MKSYRDIFESASSEALAICRKYVTQESKIGEMTDEFERFSAERLSDLKPRIMVYGIYNSGKSTLLNALMGEARAKMNDIPTTVKIDKYQWKEYTIYDTPGIDAPEKDEQVSKEQLRKSDVIIFVMGTEGNVDYAKNYRELADIVESGKRILLVLNNKSGDLVCNSVEDKDLQQLDILKRRVYLNFTQACKGGTPEEMARRYPMCIVDAKMALDARTKAGLSGEERQIMLDASNIATLERLIVDEYWRASGETIIQGLQHELRRKLNMVRSYLEDTIHNDLSRKGSRDIAEIQQLQDEMIDKIRHFANQRGSRLEGEIFHIFDDVEQTEDAIKQKIEAINNAFAQEVNEELKGQLLRLGQRVSGITTDFAGILPGELGEIHVPTAEEIKEHILQKLGC